MATSLRCECVASHSPSNRHTHQHHIFPSSMGGPDVDSNIVAICPNLHAATHQLLRITGARYDGDTPFWIRRRFPYAARELAWEGWVRWDVAGRPVDVKRWMYQGANIAVSPIV